MASELAKAIVERDKDDHRQLGFLISNLPTNHPRNPISTAVSLGPPYLVSECSLIAEINMNFEGFEGISVNGEGDTPIAALEAAMAGIDEAYEVMVAQAEEDAHGEQATPPDEVVRSEVPPRHGGIRQ